MSKEFYNGLLFLISIFIITVGVVSIAKRNQRHSNLYLGLFFFILGTTIFFRFLEASHLILKVPHLIEVDFPFCFLMSPCYLFFIKSYIAEYEPSKKEQLLQSIPAIAVFLFLLPVFVLNTPEKIDYIINEASSSHSWRYQILDFIFYVQSVGYLIYSLFILKKGSIDASEEVMSKIKWLRIFSLLLLIIKIVILIAILVIDKEKKFEQTPLSAIAILVLILVWALQKSDLLNPQKKALGEEELKIKYQDSFLSNEDIENYAQRISNLIDKKQLFLNKKISLASLAEELDLPSRTVSEVINRHFLCSFNDFINRLRVDYSKTLLLENTPAMKIDFIGEESGFGSRATFYSNFKKITGMSPSDFVKKHNLG